MHNVIQRQYFDWLYSVVSGKFGGRSYKKLLGYLHSKPFYYSVPMDGNRADDGVDLRYRFGRDHDISDAEIASSLDVAPCSVLEMMAALAIRCEEHIMDNPDIGNRTGTWFMQMLKSMGLSRMNDRNFNIEIAKERVNNMLDRKYGRDGRGGLFTVKRYSRDMRSIEIWYQLQLYLNEEILRV